MRLLVAEGEFAKTLEASDFIAQTSEPMELKSKVGRALSDGRR